VSKVLEPTSPLYPLLNEINKAAATGLPFLAVAMTVALPDICISLISADGRTSPDRYKQWCKDNLDQKDFGFVTPDDLYSMRCGVLHNGRFGDLKHNAARVIFALPGSTTFVDCKMNDAYFYSVVNFCQTFTLAVRDWYEKNKNDLILQSNLPRLMQYHEGGFLPYVSGVTVLG
jgi:hypothetical protein